MIEQNKIKSKKAEPRTYFLLVKVTIEHLVLNQLFLQIGAG